MKKLIAIVLLAFATSASAIEVKSVTDFDRQDQAFGTYAE